MEQLTDQEIEELVLGIELSPNVKEEPAPSPGPTASPPPVEAPQTPKPQIVRLRIFLSLVIALVLGFAFGVATSGFVAREKIETVSTQLDALLNKLDEYEGAGETFSTSVIEPLDTTAPFDRAA